MRLSKVSQVSKVSQGEPPFCSLCHKLWPAAYMIKFENFCKLSVHVSCKCIVPYFIISDNTNAPNTTDNTKSKQVHIISSSSIPFDKSKFVETYSPKNFKLWKPFVKLTRSLSTYQLIQSCKWTKY